MGIQVIGFGNLLLTDDAVGIRAVEQLQQRYALPETVRVISGGNSSLSLLQDLRPVDHLIIADAVLDDAAPGEVRRIAGDDLPKSRVAPVSPHDLSLSHLLSLLELLESRPASITLIGMVPDSLEMGLELSPAAQRALPLMVERLVDEIRSLGIVMQSRDDGGLEKS
jgi:hydrogenase maturation protease